MKTIVFPTDFSPVANNALDYAVNLAQVMNARLILFNACHIAAFNTNVPMYEEVDERLVEISLADLHALEAKIKSQYKDLEIDCVANFGLATENIISLSGEKHADLIVMGTTGATGIKEILLGSNAASVLREAVCPVLVIPGNVKFKQIRKIIFATDYNEGDFKSLAFLSNIASSFEAEIQLVHVSPVKQSDDYEIELLDWFKVELKKRENMDYDRISFHLLIGGNVDDKLNDFINESKADLLAMVTRNRSIISTLFERSLTKKMAFHTQIPLLSFHLGKN